MKNKNVKIGKITIGMGSPLVLIAGPCVIESERSALENARALKEVTSELEVPFIFKASYDKANRSSISSFRGPGLKEGLKILKKIKKELKVPVLSDVHTPSDAALAGRVLDVLQIPAFLCRQTDLLAAAAKTGRCVNVKKGQFMSPEEMKNVIGKLERSGARKILLTERGTTFGYNTLINDFRGVVKMKELGRPVVYDATHSVQMPGGKGTSSGGEAKYALPLSKAAVSVGCDALFLEVHKDPRKAKSDGPNMIKLSKLKSFLKEIKKLEKAVR